MVAGMMMRATFGDMTAAWDVVLADDRAGQRRGQNCAARQPARQLGRVKPMRYDAYKYLYPPRPETALALAPCR